jgi:hypothetical protein
MRLPRSGRALVLALVCICATVAGGAVRVIQDSCGPFTDVSVLLCPYVLEAFYTGITVGTSATTFSPDVPITRGQAAVFTIKGLNQSLARGSRRAALGQWWTTSDFYGVNGTPLGSYPGLPACDGTDVWVPVRPESVARVRGSDGQILATWSGVTGTRAALVAMGFVFVMGDDASRGEDLYVIDPRLPAGPISPIRSHLLSSGQMTFDGAKLWTVNSDGTLSNFGAGNGFGENVVPGSVGGQFIFFDGKNLWAPSRDDTSLLRLDLNGNVLQTVSVSASQVAFDGANLWLTSVGGNSVSIVQASTGTVLTVLTGNGMTSPYFVAFDGRRMMVSSVFAPYAASLWDAASLEALGSVNFAGNGGVCSDGLNFWIARQGYNDLARF